eukprot:TRINITY_DN2929_c0_g1_i4.p1 TRINITY_DN2929_c0_g1~~TRINITY_DN2929_c0_g1_i4.p1  ORF type:complete len:408 (-),score=57.54 TRINITY_DN2929_c0_g1_i4:122-1297(-)
MCIRDSIEDRRMTFAPENFQLEDSSIKYRSPIPEKNVRLDDLVLGSINNNLTTSVAYRPSKIKATPSKEKNEFTVIEPQEMAPIVSPARENLRSSPDRFESNVARVELRLNPASSFEPEQRPFERAITAPDDVSGRGPYYRSPEKHLLSQKEIPTRAQRFDGTIQSTFSNERNTPGNNGSNYLGSYSEVHYKETNSSYNSERVPGTILRDQQRLRTPSRDRSLVGEIQAERKDGFAIRDCFSIDGTTFLKKGEFVTITKVLDKGRVLECKWEANKALFSSDYIYSIQSASETKRFTVESQAYGLLADNSRKSPLDTGSSWKPERSPSPIAYPPPSRDFRGLGEDTQYQTNHLKYSSYYEDGGSRFNSQQPSANQREHSRHRVTSEKSLGNY